MSHDLLEQAESTGQGRRELAALSRTLDPSAVGPALAAAVSQRRDRAFSHLLLASLHAGAAVDAGVLARGAALLPDADWLAAVAGRLRGDVAAAVVEAVRERGLGWEREPLGLLVAELWCRRTGAERPPELIPEARIRGRRQLTQAGEDALVALQGLLDDPDLGALISDLVAPDVKEAARSLVSRLERRLSGDPLDLLPERALKVSVAAGPVRRAVAKVGRNDPCPCGSGKKYKSCHEAADRARNADSSDVEGLTASELRADLESHLTEERLKELRGHEVARLNPARIPPALRAQLADHLGAWGEHQAALAAVRSWWTSEAEREAVDPILRRVAELAARDGRRDLVLEAVALRGGADGLLLEARLLAAEPRDRLALLEDAAREQLDAQGTDLGFALFAVGLPALGVHVARSELVLRPRDPDTDQLYAELVEARDRLRAGPWDPLDDVLFTLERGVDPAFDRELSAERSRLQEKDAQIQAIREALEKARAERDALEGSARVVVVERPAEPAPERSPADEEALRELRRRMEELKESLKRGHQERNTLRRELEEAKERVAELESGEEEEEGEGTEAEEEDEGPALDVSVASRVRVPVLSEDFTERLRTVPEATARASMMRIGELCAGIGVVFREVRPLRGFEGTWRIKVGRSYRMLFRPLEHSLEVVDLLHRQDLEKRLFKLRRGGEP